MDQIEIIKKAFEMRKPDAYEQAFRLRARLRSELEAELRLSKLRGESAFLAARTDAFRRLAAIMEEYKNWSLNAEDEGETVEAALQRQKGRSADPLRRLVARKAINFDQYRSAREIAWIWSFVTKRLGPSSMMLDYKIDAGEPTAMTAVEAAEHVNWLHAKVYVPWCRKVGPLCSNIVISLAVEGRAMNDIRRQHRLGWKRAVDMTAGALDDYQCIRRRVI